ncbi:hypothetical protein C1N53_18445 [Pontibacter sp. SGAir0037]|nr:hypothetical protein C1N53_18445 [Pontibacter sp. SGAir0037]
MFHPLLMPTYLFAFILYYLPAPFVSFPVQHRWYILGLAFFTTFLIPGIGAYFMQRTGYIDSLEMEKREQRSLPLLFTGTCYAVTSYLFYREPVFDRVFYVAIGLIAASVFLTYIISLYWKISAHSVGMGGSLGLLLLLNRMAPEAMLLGPIMFFILLAGAVMSARLALNAHTPAQVYAGFSSGLLLAFIGGLISL